MTSPRKKFGKNAQVMAEPLGFIYGVSILLAIIVFFGGAFYVLGENSTNKLASSYGNVEAEYILIDLIDSEFEFEGMKVPAYELMYDAIYNREKYGDLHDMTVPYNLALYDNLVKYFEGVNEDMDWKVRIWKLKSDDYHYSYDYFKLGFVIVEESWNFKLGEDGVAYFQLPYNGEEGYKYVVQLEVRKK